MRVKVERVNSKLGKAVIDMNEMDYGWLEILGCYDLEEDDIFEGNFELGEEKIYNHTQKVEMDVFIEDYGCTLKNAISAIY